MIYLYVYCVETPTVFWHIKTKQDEAAFSFMLPTCGTCFLNTWGLLKLINSHKSGLKTLLTGIPNKSTTICLILSLLSFKLSCFLIFNNLIVFAFCFSFLSLKGLIFYVFLCPGEHFKLPCVSSQKTDLLYIQSWSSIHILKFKQSLRKLSKENEDECLYYCYVIIRSWFVEIRSR